MLRCVFVALTLLFQALCWFTNADSVLRVTPENEASIYQAAELYKAAQQADQVADKMRLFQKSIDAYPDLAAAYNNLAMLVFERHGDQEQAVQLLERGLQAAEATNDVDNIGNIHNNLGFIARCNGRLSVSHTLEAIRHFDLALQAAPNHIDALYNKASALLALRHDREAQELFLKVLEQNPNELQAHLDLGRIYFEQGNLEKALMHEDSAVAAAPTMHQKLHGMHNKGTFLKETGFLVEAVKVYDDMLAINSHEAYVLVNAMTCKRLLCDWRDMEALENRALIAVLPELDHDSRRDNASFLPYDSTLVEVSGTFRKELAIAASKVYEQPSTLELLPSPWTENDPSWDRPLMPQRMKIGYLSFDFRDHPMGHLTLGLVEQHASLASGVDTYCYSYGPSSTAASVYWRRHFEEKCSVFRDLIGLSDLEAAQTIGLDGIDLLVDLMAHTKGARLGIPALRPSKIAVNYLGFPGTMGSSFIDFVMVDRMVVPPEVAAATMTEQVVYLPHTYQANRYEVSIEACGADIAGVECQRANRTQEGLPQTGFVFCNFNTINKMESKSFAVWMGILRQVPDSVLWLLAPQGRDANHVMDSLREQAKAHGVRPSRLVFAKRVDKLTHLARVSIADLFLDSFIYNAHSTAADALWANVPIVTFWGDTFPSRVAASLILNAMPFPELVSYSVKDYEQVAVYLATTPKVLRRIRRELAAHTLASPLFDTRETTKSVEVAYEAMHDVTNRLHPFTKESHHAHFQLIIHPARTADAFKDRGKRDARLSDAMKQGIFLQETGDFSAQHVYSRVLRTDPKNVHAVQLLGTLFYQAGQFERAVKCLTQAVDASPHVSWYHSNLGVAYVALGSLQLAEKEFLAALQLDATNLMAISQLARVYVNKKAFDKVIDVYTSFGNAAYFDVDLNQQANPSAKQIEDAYLEYTEALTEIGRSLDAIQLLQSAIPLHPTLFRLRYNLAVLFNDHERYDEGNEQQIAAVIAEGRYRYEKDGKHFTKIPRPEYKIVIAIYCHEYGQAWWEPWGPSSLKTGLGGSEEAVVFLARELQKLGYWVEVYGDPPPGDISRPDQASNDVVRWYPLYAYDIDDAGVDIFVAWRYHISLAMGKAVRKKYLWMHDVPHEDAKRSPLLHDADGIFCVSEYQKSKFPELLQPKITVSTNALDPSFFKNGPNHADRFVYGSAPTRGLYALLKAWPRIRESIPTAELSVFYGFRPAFLEWGRKHMSNFTDWKTEIDRLLSETPGVRNVGLVDHARLAEEYSYAGFYLYPTTFSETSCISLMKAMASGAIPITSRYPNSALPETVGDYDLGPRALQAHSIPEDPEWYELWIRCIIDAVRDEQQATTLRHRMKRFARKTYRWEHIALQWHRVISKPRFP
ncbi:hypothetical protein PHYBOEH_007514 [Phytophthora boehmeriae]|uniref:O-GlcNAc transferase C-terminal domain-containing protein n=1 Tax=Phytophthora boehmeriae TaxID=109152 RepID=A0A8T1WAW1_9STRA|nr:hypothetical protein PHYBOEH_007514 [Phytophthora boehmeriae]